ncbi:TPA: galactokinase [bacterium]|nr:galactokinase [bacterium]
MADHLQFIIPVILAGGKGTRLAGVCPNIPKVIAPVAGRPFLEYLLIQLVRTGFTKVILCVGYLKDQVINTFGTRYKTMEIIYSVEDIPLGTGGALRNAIIKNDIKEKYLLVMNGDSFVDISMAEYILWHINGGYDFSLVLVEVADVSRYGSVYMDRKGKVVLFGEKSKSGKGTINGGIYIFKKDVVASFLQCSGESLEHDMLPLMLTHGLYGFEANGDFIDIGTPESYTISQSVMMKKHEI